MTIHELGTNAIKYGALSKLGGRVDISWQGAVDNSSSFQFIWEEKNGPVVTKPSRIGFGSRLMNRIIEGDFGGEVELNYEPSGLFCRVTAPMRNLDGE
jgi:two-component sensor histidine kinase